MGISISLGRGLHCPCFSHTEIPTELELCSCHRMIRAGKAPWTILCPIPTWSPAQSTHSPLQGEVSSIFWDLWPKPALCELPTAKLSFSIHCPGLEGVVGAAAVLCAGKTKVFMKSDIAAPCAASAVLGKRT